MSTGRSPHTDELAQLAKQWREALDKVTRQDVGRARALLANQLLSAESVQEFADARRQQRRLVRHAQTVTGLLADLVTRIDELQAEWEGARRYSDAGVDDLCEQLSDVFELDPPEGRRRWLREVMKALEMAEGHAAARIAAFKLPLEGEERSVASELVQAVHAWNDGQLDTGLALTRSVADGTLGERLGVDDARIRGRAYRIAAWLSFVIFNDPEAARAELDAAISLLPNSGRARAERGALLLRLGEVDRATNDAHRAVEARPSGATGHLVLGACAEFANDLTAADNLYRTGLLQMSPYELATAYRRVSLLEPTGRMLLRMGERLLELDRAESALRVIDEALRRFIADPRPYGHVDAHRLRSVTLERMGRMPEAARAALEAGKRQYWHNELEDATNQLARARELDDKLSDAGWYLAEVLINRSYPEGTFEPDRDLVVQAHRVWEETRKRFGWPAGRDSWAFLTRATIADAISHGANVSMEDAAWEALFYAERAIVHELVDVTFADGDRWVVAARYLSEVGLDELALECADRADALGTTAYPALAQRMALLAKAGCFDEVERVATRLESEYGTMDWVTGVRGWVAYHDGRFEAALELLAGPLAENDVQAVHWFYALSALCHLGLGNRDDALEAYAAMLERADDSADQCELAIANAALGHVTAALGVLRRADAEPSTDPIDLDCAASFIEIIDGNIDNGIGRLTAAIKRTTTVRQLDDVLREADLRLELLPQPEAQSEARRRLQQALAETVVARRSELEDTTATAASLLDDTLSHYAASAPDGMPHCVLRAVKARRLMQEGSCDEAADLYDALTATPFAPEALAGLRSALEAASAERSDRGDLAAVREIQSRLSRHGWAGPADTAAAAAAALVAANRHAEALEELRQALSVTAEAEPRRALHERVATVAMAQADPVIADRHLAAALELTNADDEAAHVARLEVRRSIAAALSKDFSAVSVHLRSAMDAWAKADAFDPAASMREELSLAIRDSLAPAMAATLTALVAPLLKKLSSEWVDSDLHGVQQR
jgi:tetratricopeptide (TPR) repeat protein